ncbi:MAG: RecQ family ATP-dependent DNA helicase [Chitinophagales bacterium]|nr:RecQ family ATP-dependent DNA helicase [Chitinophagales bacterium]
MSTPKEILKQYWGYDTFRTPQEDIIQAVLEDKDVLAILPTGGGKSVCFQVPAMLREGLCLVISPLIALMKDQVLQLKNRKIKAGALFTGLSNHEMETILDNAQFGWYKFLYVSPERLKSEWFLTRIKQMNIGLLAVDEAHCISQWGYDFRPTYLEIAAIKKIINPCPTIALTASATPNVQQDIMEKLAFRQPLLFSKSFLRDNISFICRNEEAKSVKLLEIVQKTKGSGLIYTRNRKKTEEITDFLKKNNINSSFYHAGLKAQERSKRQDSWIKGETSIMSCTNAFGMGIDKPDVRVVVHMDLPDSLEAYYQEAGRAGRDGKLAYAVALYKQTDIQQLRKNVTQLFPPHDVIKTTYNALCNYLQVAVHSGEMMTYPFEITEFCRVFHLQQQQVYYSLKLLEDEGFLSLSEGVWLPSRVKIIAQKSVLYKYQVENPKHEPLLKLLLRTYGGILEGYIKINESFLGRKLKISEAEVKNLLILLSKQNMLRYNMSNDEPHITFLRGRVVAEDLRLDVKRQVQRKAAVVDRVEAMIGYITQEEICRQVYIAQYFGEKNPLPCGKCDHCIEKRKNQNTSWKCIEDAIFQIIGTSALTLDDLLAKVDGHYTKQDFLTTLRFLLDEQQLKINSKNEISKV